MNYIYHDAGRSVSNRPKQKNDCVIRAIALASGILYDEIYDLFASKGRKCSHSTSKKVWQDYLKSQKDFVKISFPARKGEPRMSLADFARGFDEGRFIVQCAGHLTCIADGIVYDDFKPRENACVYAAWMKIPNKRENYAKF